MEDRRNSETRKGKRKESMDRIREDADLKKNDGNEVRRMKF